MSGNNVDITIKRPSGNQLSRRQPTVKLLFFALQAQVPAEWRGHLLHKYHTDKFLFMTDTSNIKICSNSTNKIHITYSASAVSIRTAQSVLNTKANINIVKLFLIFLAVDQPYNMQKCPNCASQIRENYPSKGKYSSKFALMTYAFENGFNSSKNSLSTSCLGHH